MLERPCPMNSWLESMCWPVRKASARAMDMASVSANSVMAKVTEESERHISRLKLGAESGGRLDGNAPTVRTAPGLIQFST